MNPFKVLLRTACAALTAVLLQPGQAALAGPRVVFATGNRSTTHVSQPPGQLTLVDGARSTGRRPADELARIPASATAISGVGAMTVEGGGDPFRLADRIASIPGVAWAEVDRTYRPLGSDPKRKAQWALDSIHAAAGWLLAGINPDPISSGPSIAVIDTGADRTHEDLRGRIRACGAASSGRVREGTCDDWDGHGTHVAGIAGAATGNGIGISAVAAGSPLVICRAIGPSGEGSGSDVAACIGWALRQRAKVISMSLGGPDSRALRAAVDAAAQSGALVIAAAGNDGTSARQYPAAYGSVVSVAATSRNGQRAQFSNFNADVEIAAPGTAVLSLSPGNRYRLMDGTSVAAPHVAGAAALLWQAHPGDTAAAIRARLDSAVRDLGRPGRDAEYGFGSLDLARNGL